MALSGVSKMENCSVTDAKEVRVEIFSVRLTDGCKGGRWISASSEWPSSFRKEVTFSRRPLHCDHVIMDIQVATLCDAATDSLGKLNLLGAFDTINAGQMPAIHPQCSIALRIMFRKIEEGTHKLKLNFVDEDGRLVMPSIDIPVEVAVPEDTTYISRNFIINIQQLKFANPGQYAIDIALDGRQAGSIPLMVRLHEQNKPAPNELDRGF